MQESFCLLRALLCADCPLDKPSLRAVTKWLRACSRGSAPAEAEADGDDADGEAVALPEALAADAEAGSRAHEATLGVLLSLSSSLPRVGAASARADGGAEEAPAAKPTRKLTKKGAAGRA